MFANFLSFVVKLRASESISHVHRGYFRLVDTRRLYAAELAVPLIVLWRRTKTLATTARWSPIALRNLASAHDVLFAVVLVI